MLWHYFIIINHIFPTNSLHWVMQKNIHYYLNSKVFNFYENNATMQKKSNGSKKKKIGLIFLKHFFHYYYL